MSYRIVLDTNCIISALMFSREKMAWLRHSWQSGAIIPLVNKETVTELLKVLTYPKFKLTRTEQSVLLADFLPYDTAVLTSATHRPVDPVMGCVARIKGIKIEVVSDTNAGFFGMIKIVKEIGRTLWDICHPGGIPPHSKLPLEE